MPKLTKQALIERRLEGGRLLIAGNSPPEVARKVGVSRQTVYAWKLVLSRNGNDLEALNELDQGGPRPRLSKSDKQKLESLLTTDQSADLLPPPGWTLKRINRLIEKHFGVSYTPQQIWRLLKEMDLSKAQIKNRAAATFWRQHITLLKPTAAQRRTRYPAPLSKP